CTRRRSGIATLSESAWLSIPKGPSARVSQTISGPSVNIKGFSASAIPAVTTRLEFGLMTMMRGRDMGGSCVSSVDGAKKKQSLCHGPYLGQHELWRLS